MNKKRSIWLLIAVAGLVLVAGGETWIWFNLHRQAKILAAHPVAPWIEKWMEPALNPERWNPVKDMERVQDRINQWFGHSLAGILNGRFDPEVDVRETTDAYQIRVHLRGMEADQVKVDLQGQELVISGEREIQKEKKDRHGEIILQERQDEAFNRTVHLDAPVHRQGMITVMQNGLLEITVPKGKSS